MTAMPKRKALSPVEREYRAERRRISRQIQRMEKRGYQFAESPLPAVPKKVTPASVRRLKGITTPKLYQKSEYVSPLTGESMPGVQGRGYERSHRGESAPEQSVVILNHVREQLDRWFPDPGWRPSMRAAKQGDVNTARAILSDALITYGEQAVARNLENSAGNIYDILEKICYASDSQGQVSASLVEFTQILTGHSLSMADNMFITERAERMDFDEFGG